MQVAFTFLTFGDQNTTGVITAFVMYNRQECREPYIEKDDGRPRGNLWGSPIPRQNIVTAALSFALSASNQ